MGKKIVLYFMALSAPLALALSAWQATRYAVLKRELERNNRLQIELIEKNRRLITEIAALSASSRIDRLARDNLGLGAKKPEAVLHLSIRP